MQVKKFKESTSLGIAPSRHAFDKIRVLVFNRFQVNVKAVTGRAIDTDFQYIMSTNDKVNKAKLQSIADYIDGILDTIRSY